MQSKIPKAFRLLPSTIERLEQAKGEDGWDTFFLSLLQDESERSVLPMQIQAQAQRFKKTNGQVLRFIAALMSFEELNFINISSKNKMLLLKESEKTNESESEIVNRLISQEFIDERRTSEG